MELTWINNDIRDTIRTRIENPNVWNLGIVAAPSGIEFDLDRMMDTITLEVQKLFGYDPSGEFMLDPYLNRVMSEVEYYAVCEEYELELAQAELTWERIEPTYEDNEYERNS